MLNYSVAELRIYTINRALCSNDIGNANQHENNNKFSHILLVLKLSCFFTYSKYSIN